MIGDAIRVLCGDGGCGGCGEVEPVNGEWIPTPESAFGEWACENCAKGPVHPYATRLVEIYLLRRGGYIFGPDDLDPVDRVMLGVIDMAVERRSIYDAVERLFGDGD